MPHGMIHDHKGTVLDEDGDYMVGFYFEICSDLNIPLCLLMGPYGSAIEAEAACQLEYDTGSY